MVNLKGSLAMTVSGEIILCQNCDFVGPANKRGSGGIEIALWLTFLFPIALVYSIWRRGGGTCPTCGSNLILPPTSPKAQGIIGSSASVAETVKIYSEKKENQQAKKSNASILIFSLIGLVFIVFIINIIIARSI